MARRIIHTIFNPSTIWAMDSGYAESFYPLINNIIKGNTFGAKLDIPECDVPFMMELGKLNSRVDIINSSFSNSGNQSQKYNAVIPITGPIIKYTEECGQVGTETIARWIREADSNPNISAIILKIDSGGGEGYATMNISATIKAATKPVVAFIDGMAASAAYWIASACQEIYMAYETDAAGSIGTYVTIPDWKAYYASEGLPIHEVYASASTDKNADFKAALEGKYDGLIKNYIDPFNESFKNAVAENRGDKIKNIEAATTGKMFSGKEAVKVGLVDGIKTFNETLARAEQLSTKSNSSTTNSTKMNMQTKFPSVASATGLTEVETSAEGVHFQESHLTALESALQSANAAKTTAEMALETANAAKAQAEADLATEKEAHEALKASNPGANAAGEAPADDQGENGKEKVIVSESDAELAAARKASGWKAAE